jgi:hypothetical protein
MRSESDRSLRISRRLISSILLLLAASAAALSGQSGTQPGGQQLSQPENKSAAPAPASASTPNQSPAPVPSAPSAQSTPHAVPAQNQQLAEPFAEQSALLLKLATELKAEVDKTNKDTLSIDVIRKAEEIERTAHGMRVAQGMKDKFGASAGAGGGQGAN